MSDDWVKVTLDKLPDYLEAGPVMAQMNPLSLAFLPLERLKLRVFESTAALVATLDNPQSECGSDAMLALDYDPEYSDRLISLKVNHQPLTTHLNQHLKGRWELVRSRLLCQSHLPEFIAGEASAECIILILVDGLSWADFSAYWRNGEVQAQPVLVDGASTTEQGMKRIVGKPAIAERLLSKGYDRTYGFSYWTRDDNALTNHLFDRFSTNVDKVRSFQNVLKQLEKLDLTGAYIQIVRQGLDGLCHKHRDRPNPEHYVHDLVQDWYALLKLLGEKGISAQVFLTSDHGILWKEGHTDFRVQFPGKHTDPPRYFKQPYPSPQTLEIPFEGMTYSLLAYPYLRRNFNVNEWGVHGGLSFEESVVPLLTTSINHHN